MAKKVKFPLDMGNDIMVRDIDELKENFNIEKVTEYFLNGKLLTWLNDRFYDEEAEQVEELSTKTDKSVLAIKLCQIFDIEIENDVDIETLERRKERLERLRSITSDDEVLANVDSVAFSQEELGDLLDEDIEVIYLCGEKFRIPLSVKSKKYIGVNEPEITISTKNEKIDLSEYSIAIEKCTFSDKTMEKIVKENNDIADEPNNSDGALEEYEQDEKKINDPRIEKIIIGIHNFTEKKDAEISKQCEERWKGKGVLGTIMLNDHSVTFSTEFINWSGTGYKNSAMVMDALEKQYEYFINNKADALNDPNVDNIYYCNNITTITAGCLLHIGGGMLPISGNAATIRINVPMSKLDEFKETYAVKIALSFLSEKIPPNKIEIAGDGLAPLNDFHAYYIINMPKLLKLFANERGRETTYYQSKEGYTISISGYENVNMNSVKLNAAKYSTSFLSRINDLYVRNTKNNIYDRIAELLHDQFVGSMDYDNKEQLTLDAVFSNYTTKVNLEKTDEIEKVLIQQNNDCFQSISKNPIIYSDNINAIVSGSLIFSVSESSSTGWFYHESPLKLKGSGAFIIYIYPHKFADFAKEYLSPIVYIPCNEKFSDEFLCFITKVALRYKLDNASLIPGYYLNVPKLLNSLTYDQTDDLADKFLHGRNDMCRTDCFGTPNIPAFKKVYESENSYKRCKAVSSAIKTYNEMSEYPFFKYSVPII